jgi:hypothetical protein
MNRVPWVSAAQKKPPLDMGPSGRSQDRADARGCDGGVRKELAQKLGSRSLAQSSSSPWLRSVASECPICPMSVNLTPYRIR